MPVSLTVVGSIAFDAVRSPFGERERMLGGAAVHFSLAASFFCDVRVVGPVGDDFGDEEYAVLHGRGVNTDDVEHVAGGETFFWRAHYDYDLNTAHTEDTRLGVFGDFKPKLSEASRAAEVVFLANIQPDLQREVREQCRDARLVGLDSMNLWIETAKDSLSRTIEGVDLVLMNDAEIRMFTEEPNRVRAARGIMQMGPRAVVAKQGEYGAALYTGDRLLRAPGVSARDRQRPDRRGRLVRGGLSRLPRLGRPRGGGRPGGPAPGHDLRLRARVVLRRGVRHGAREPADARRDRRRFDDFRRITELEAVRTG